MTISIPLHLDNTTEQILSEEAKQRGISIETLVLQFVRQGIGLKSNTTPVIKQRVLGLHQGLGWMSADFDAPLDDEFWLQE
ncbi:hypothetical protein BCS42_14760 [Crenothrix sp. D3]|nr:hypothetical protein BCS42_14760 [Crenothrix sp. D3]